MNFNWTIKKNVTVWRNLAVTSHDVVMWQLHVLSEDKKGNKFASQKRLAEIKGGSGADQTTDLSSDQLVANKRQVTEVSCTYSNFVFFNLLMLSLYVWLT